MGALRIVMMQAFEQPPAPSSVRSGLAAVDPFFARALAKKADDRFQSAAEMRAALDALASMHDER
jgi:hypothetical protein